jgi:exosortase K
MFALSTALPPARVRLRVPPASDVACWAFVVGGAYALKRYYATASPESLRWVLAPTAWLVDAATEAAFVFESHVGYVSIQAATAIVPGCAGLNFLVMVFGMLGTAFVGRFQRFGSKLQWIGASAVVAYAVTVVVNAGRIRLGMFLRGHSLPLDADHVHRMEGVIVYLGVLLLVHSAGQAMFARAGR